MSFFSMVSNLFRKTLTCISPDLNIRFVYRIKKKKRLNTEDPQSFSEKLVYVRLTNYNHNPLVKQLADKYAVRDYVKKKGYEELLNELYAVFDAPKQIDFEKLPSQFALKLNVGCGCNYICMDKSKINATEIAEITRKWMKKKPWLPYAEMQYKGVEKKILLEKYLEGHNGTVPEDYKVYCFHGKPLAILYMSGRFTEQTRVGFFDSDWNYLGMKENSRLDFVTFDKSHLPPRPESLSMMVSAAETLSGTFPFVRIDFYDVDGRAIFGEMTFSPAGGYDAAEVDINGKSMAEYLHV